MLKDKEHGKEVQWCSFVIYCLMGWEKNWSQGKEQGDEQLGLELRWAKGRLQVRNPVRKTS